jgi:hypothetical protein
MRLAGFCGEKSKNIAKSAIAFGNHYLNALAKSDAL